MADKTMREKIAEIILAVRQYLLNTEFAPEPLGEPVDPKKLTEYFPDAILAILEIKEGQELREKAESGKLVELDDDQSMPKNPYEPFMFWHQPYCNKAKMELYGQAQDDMTEAGFWRVKVKE